MGADIARLNFKASGGLAAGRASYDALIEGDGLLVPRGYTFNTLVTEWLVVNCHGDWASLSINGPRVRVRFFSAADFERARLHFRPNRAWRSPSGGAVAGFRHAAAGGPLADRRGD